MRWHWSHGWKYIKLFGLIHSENDEAKFRIQNQWYFSEVLVNTVIKMNDNLSLYENVSKMEVHNATFYPTEATILAAVCACIFSVVGVVGKFTFYRSTSTNLCLQNRYYRWSTNGTCHATNYSRKALKLSLFIGCKQSVIII